MSSDTENSEDYVLQGYDVDLDVYENIEYPENIQSVKDKNVSNLNNSGNIETQKLKSKSIPLQYLEPAERAILTTLNKDSNAARLIKYKNTFLKLSVQDVLVNWKNANVDILRETLSLIDDEDLSLIAFIKIIQKKDRTMYFGMTIY